MDADTAKYATAFNVLQTAIASMQTQLRSDATQLAIARSLDASRDYATTSSNAARIISNQIRQLDPSRHDAGQPGNTGRTSNWQVHVRVRWGFVTFPAAIVLVGAVALLGTMLDTKRLGLEPLKAGAEATLLCGLDERARQALRAAAAAPPVKGNRKCAQAEALLLGLVRGNDGPLELRLRDDGEANGDGVSSGSGANR